MSPPLGLSPFFWLFGVFFDISTRTTLHLEIGRCNHGSTFYLSSRVGIDQPRVFTSLSEHSFC
ncbi:MAG: hypothetical protein VW804_02820, partial [Verrucomicrobiota bacterium]